jgi:hypothetical protein
MKQYLHVKQTFTDEILKIMDSLLLDHIFDEANKPAYVRQLEVNSSPEPRFAHSVYEILPNGHLEFIGEDWDGSG